MEGRYRATLINKVAGYKTANLIGTRSQNGLENLALFNSVVHIGANPPLLGFVLRPTEVPRHTYDNLKQTGCFTINMVVADIHQQAHRTSGKYPVETSEFEACGLTPSYLERFPAPYVAESPVRIGLTFQEEHQISNGTRLIVGRVEHLFLPEEIIGPDGDVPLDELHAVAIGGLDSYYTGVKLGRYGYFRPGEALRRLDP